MDRTLGEWGRGKRRTVKNRNRRKEESHTRECGRKEEKSGVRDRRKEEWPDRPEKYRRNDVV